MTLLKIKVKNNYFYTFNSNENQKSRWFLLYTTNVIGAPTKKVTAPNLVKIST